MHKSGPFVVKSTSLDEKELSELSMSPGQLTAVSPCSPPHLSLEEQAKHLNEQMKEITKCLSAKDFTVGNVTVSFGRESVFLDRPEMFTMGFSISYSELRPLVEGLKKVLECN